MNKKWTVKERRIAPPAFILLFAVLIGLLINWLYPIKILSNSLAIGIGILLFLLAGPIAFLTFRSYSNKETTFLFTEPSTTIVTNGPNRFSRNPGYLSLIMLFSSLSFLANSIWSMGMIIPAALVIHYGIVRREERYLEDIFSGAYLKYKNSVRRWL